MGILSTNSSTVPSKLDASFAAEGDQAQPATWQASLRAAIRNESELRSELGLSDHPKHCSSPASSSDDHGFPVFVPREYLARIQPGCPNDPLLLQVLPQSTESTKTPGFSTDPVGDLAATQNPGVIQKYQSRALLIVTGVCAVHCRYCFRRHFPYGESKIDLATLEPALRQLAADEQLDEIILSGGDPLMMNDDWLSRLVERLAEIPNIQRLRVHTRLPIMIPSRVTSELLEWFTATRLTPILVLHVNHVAELHAADVVAAIRRIVDAGVPVLNQAVLLRGINDDVDTMADLCRELVNLRVMPYYLHQLDRVEGAAHFEVPEHQGKAIISGLRERLPGYAVPRFVKEIPGQPGKTILA